MSLRRLGIGQLQLYIRWVHHILEICQNLFSYLNSLPLKMLRAEVERELSGKQNVKRAYFPIEPNLFKPKLTLVPVARINKMIFKRFFFFWCLCLVKFEWNSLKVKLNSSVTKTIAVLLMFKRKWVATIYVFSLYLTGFVGQLAYVVINTSTHLLVETKL